jgi:hypothetical protein
MPCNFASAINIENAGPISWTLLIEGALSRGVDRGVFKKNQGIGSFAGRDFAMNSPLDGKGILIFD